MKELFIFRHLSWKIAAIILAAVAFVAAPLAVYMQSRTMVRIDLYSRENLKLQIFEAIDESDLAFIDATYSVSGLRNLAESYLKVEMYKNDPVNYMNVQVKIIVGAFIRNMLNNSEYIEASYLTFHPDLAGYPFVGELYLGKTPDGIVAIESLDYEDYLETDSPDMEWFFGAYNSGEPYWTHIYEDEGTIMVSYVEPVFIGGEKVGIVGVDIPIGHIEDLIRGYRVYETGFALVEDRYGEFVETNDFIMNLSPEEKAKLAVEGDASNGEVFNISLGGADFVATQAYLSNGYSIYILAPQKEYGAEASAAMRRILLLFPPVLILVLLISYAIGRSISKPFVVISGVVDSLAKGELHTSALDPFMKLPDETGVLARSVRSLRIRLGDLTEEVKMIADGNLTGEIKLAFQGDAIGTALLSTQETLNNMFSDLKDMSLQITSESGQLSNNSHLLADGCTKQAEAVDHLTKTMESIIEHNNQNVEMLQHALLIEDQVIKDAKAGDQNLKHLSEAVHDINEASKGINKVLKSIEDIAFQTNILALNAAVEAARAGVHGKGFSVVADEVRSLAQKSAGAAKESADLIELSTQKAAAGNKLADITAESFMKIVEGITQSDEMIKQIAENSKKSNVNAAQMSDDLKTVSLITQQTAASAEELSAMSEEMNNQADTQREQIGTFKIKESGKRRIGAAGLPDKY